LSTKVADVMKCFAGLLCILSSPAVMLILNHFHLHMFKFRVNYTLFLWNINILHSPPKNTFILRSRPQDKQGV
jgi:hypothetical protein